MDGGAAEARERTRIKAAVKSNFRQLRTQQNEIRKTRDQRLRTTAPLQQTSAHICTLGPTDHESNGFSTNDTGSLMHKQWTSLEETEVPVDAKDAGGLSAQEAGLVMYYLDHVFSWQFPYSSSQFRLGQRGWILWLLMRRGPFYDAAMSLAALHRRAKNHRNDDDGDDDEYWQNQRILNHHSRALQRLCDFCQREGGTKLLENKTSLIEFLACGLFLISFECWKQDKTQRGVLNVRELVDRAREIEACLEQGLDTLGETTEATLESQVNWVSLVFTLAALVLLHSIVSGPLPALPEMKDTIRKGAVALRNGPKNSSANCLMWAICVLGS
ncbi:hypothetical protein E8E14_000884 [Neopestalotiopsis sp. 37M]|nr:hypothetical protein E8E14_000884 [Neopestalotiopsis sp. 37M]